MIAVVQQEGHFSRVDWLGFEVVEVEYQQHQQPHIVRDVRWRTEREERKAQRIDCQMPLNSVRRFVEAKAFGLDARVTGILHRL